MAFLQRLWRRPKDHRTEATGSSASGGTLGVQDLKSLVVPLMAQGDRMNDIEVAMVLIARVVCGHCGVKVTARDAWLPSENRMACPHCHAEWFKYSYGK